jgi:hypothetical protein
VISKILENGERVATKNIINILESINIRADEPMVENDRKIIEQYEKIDGSNLPDDELIGSNTKQKRQDLILQILENKSTSAKEITDKINLDRRIPGVNERTVQRDLESFVGSRGVTVDSAKRPYLWQRRTGKSIELTKENQRKHELALAVMTAKKQL